MNLFLKWLDDDYTLGIWCGLVTGERNTVTLTQLIVTLACYTHHITSLALRSRPMSRCLCSSSASDSPWPLLILTMLTITQCYRRRPHISYVHFSSTHIFGSGQEIKWLAKCQTHKPRNDPHQSCSNELTHKVMELHENKYGKTKWRLMLRCGEVG